MKFSVLKEDFLKSLSRIQGVIERRSAMPILSNVLIEGDGESLTFTATDLEVGIRTECPASIEAGGQIAISAKHLYDIVKELPEQPIVIQSQNQNRILLSCGKGEFQIVGVAPEDFPKFPDYSQYQFSTLPTPVLKEMIGKTAFSMSTDESRQNLNGIFMESLAGPAEPSKALRMVATDGHRLSLIEKIGGEMGEELSLSDGVILPKKGVLEVRKMADEGADSVKIAIQGNDAIFLSDECALFMRLIEGKYPSYSQVIPENNKRKLQIRRKEFIDSLKRVSLLSHEKSRGVKLALHENGLVVSAVNPELGEAKEDLAVQYSGPDMEIGFNAKYLIDALSVHDDEEVILELDDRLSPGVIRSAEDQRHLCVIMPMRLN